MPGKVSKLKAHLKSCLNITNETRTQALAELPADKENVPPPRTLHGLPYTQSDPGPSTPARPLKRSRTGMSSFEDDSAPQWSTSLQEDFNDDLLKLFVSCGFSWNSASDPQMGLFVEKWIPGAKLPDRRALSGRILDREVERVEARTRERIKGKVATGQCDGWKNVAKTSVVTSMITVEHMVSFMANTRPFQILTTILQAYLVRTHDMSGLPKTGDQLLAIVESDIQFIIDKFDVIVIAWCTDDGPDGKKMRRLLGAKYRWMIMLLCWAHQMNLVVGDFLSLKADFRRIIALALDIVKWFNNHGKALDLLRTEQKLTYQGQSWALILPVITRWTAHYLSLTRLLKMEAAIRTCCSRHKPVLLELPGRAADAKEAAAVVLRTVGDESFWAEVQKYVGIGY
jgi:hypothetical protein